MRWCSWCRTHRMTDCKGNGCAATLHDKHTDHGRYCDCATQEPNAPETRKNH